MISFNNRVKNRLIKWLSSFAAALIPRSNKIWVVGGNQGLRFADNSMYFFLYCSANAGKNIIWLTRSKGIIEEVHRKGGQAHLTNSLWGLYYGFRAKWHVYDVGIGDTNAFSSRGAKRLNLWHGYPLKDLTFLKGVKQGNPTPKNGAALKIKVRRLRKKMRSERHDYLLWQNTKYMDHALNSFNVRADNIIIANYPRNMVFSEGFDEDYYFPQASKVARLQINEFREKGKKIIGYFPTWRGDDGDLFMGMEGEDQLLELGRFCEQNDIIIVTKWHTCLYKEYDHSGQSERAQGITSILYDLPSILVLGFELDLNSILNKIDILVTDYSGVLFDFLWSDRPIIFFPYDLENYRKNWGFFFDYVKFVPGDIVLDTDALKKRLEEYCSNPDGYSSRHKEARESVCSDIFEVTTGTPLIVEKMKSVN